jgi:hypothetical protein
VQSGKIAAALRQYEVYQRLLAEKVGVQPSADITAFFEEINSKVPGQPAVAQPRADETIWLSQHGERRVNLLAICLKAVCKLVCMVSTTGKHSPIGDTKLSLSRNQPQTKNIFRSFCLLEAQTQFTTSKILENIHAGISGVSFYHRSCPNFCLTSEYWLTSGESLAIIYIVKLIFVM